MANDEFSKRARHLIKPFCITDRQSFRLKDFDPADTLDFKSEDKPRVKENLVAGVQALAKLQEVLYAQNRWAVLVIFQGMDTAGKDSVIKHVMSGVNPQGCQVHSFKAPSSEELDHDHLWGCFETFAGARRHRPFQS
jgi:polyphosphate kinase 2 (PPK2 family)